ncbi:SDR family oxidoreductase [Permianibacter sp. IMCC34836]|uniref:SDR family oxidoreductase n=1 Tax=Permianibacter fluminis TaxID=2738515 RepID=UPI001554B672|nr:SDR family oxidoreductase [Permianibacter fluminis]NQD35578.1 SDR family oxidoreductase [Permianibacter fluminis]
MASLTAFVTGATGFVGTNLVKLLTERGWQVRALCRQPARAGFLDRFPVEKVQGELDDVARLAQLIPSGVDAVFHVAGDTSIWPRERVQQYQTNVIGTRNMVNAALAVGAKRFIHTSSIAAFGLRDDVVNEHSAPLGKQAPIHYYQTKALAEEEVRAGISRGLSASFINPGHILGPFDTNNWARLFLLTAAKKLPGVPPGSGMFADVREVAKAHLAAVRYGAVGMNYFLGGDEIRFLELLQQAGAALGVPVPTRPLPAPLIYLVGAIKETAAAVTNKVPDVTREGARIVCSQVRCDSSRAITDLGYQPTPPAQLLADTLAWLRDEGLLR